MFHRATPVDIKKLGEARKYLESETFVSKFNEAKAAKAPLAQALKPVSQKKTDEIKSKTNGKTEKNKTENKNKTKREEKMWTRKKESSNFSILILFSLKVFDIDCISEDTPRCLVLLSKGQVSKPQSLLSLIEADTFFSVFTIGLGLTSNRYVVWIEKEKGKKERKKKKERKNQYGFDHGGWERPKGQVEAKKDKMILLS